jgi:hypothetical protein
MRDQSGPRDARESRQFATTPEALKRSRVSPLPFPWDAGVCRLFARLLRVIPASLPNLPCALATDALRPLMTQVLAFPWSPLILIRHRTDFRICRGSGKLGLNGDIGTGIGFECCNGFSLRQRGGNEADCKSALHRRTVWLKGSCNYDGRRGGYFKIRPV